MLGVMDDETEWLAELIEYNRTQAPVTMHTFLCPRCDDIKHDMFRLWPVYNGALAGLQVTSPPAPKASSPPSTPASVAKLPGASHIPQKKKKCWSSCLDAQTLKLARTEACFTKIESDPRLDYDLPRAGAAAGQVISHAKAVVQRALDAKSPMTFKIGFTHCMPMVPLLQQYFRLHPPTRPLGRSLRSLCRV